MLRNFFENGATFCYEICNYFSPLKKIGPDKPFLFALSPFLGLVIFIVINFLISAVAIISLATLLLEQ
jgi:hypothetical protein